MTLSDSLIIHQVKNKVLSVEKIYQKLKTLFEHITKDLEVRPKYSAARRIFDFLLII